MSDHREDLISPDALTTVQSALGPRVQALVATNALLAFNAFVAAMFAVPTEYFQSWARRIRSESEAQTDLMSRMPDLAAKKIGKDPDLTERATSFVGGRMLREQRSREKVLQGALDDLKANPPKEDAKRPIDEDWLYEVAKRAETRTNEEMQAYFSKLVAGEIRSPGSFSIQTVDVLSKMTPAIGKLFQNLCGMVTAWPKPDVFITSPFSPTADSRGLPELVLVPGG